MLVGSAPTVGFANSAEKQKTRTGCLSVILVTKPIIRTVCVQLCLQYLKLVGNARLVQGKFFHVISSFYQSEKFFNFVY